MTNTDQVTLEGYDWKATLTREEYAKWSHYADTHPWLVLANYRATLTMFLSHLRAGVDLNQKVNHGQN